jgi:NADPH:quinone reductase-like Zn-dependent oxidoreductase
MSESAWRPLGKFVLVRLNMIGSLLELQADQRYDSTGEVLAVGPDVENLREGDQVLMNGPQGVLSHPVLGEHIALVAAPLLLAKRVDYKTGVGEES